MLSSRERTGVVIIRVWLEADDEHRFRARVTWVRDLEEKDVESAVASSAGEVVDMVQRFVSEFSAN